ncbi:MAG: hypothetical protein IMZ47_06660 [Firmicutes bacterium]|nr:hypothetical protein [Bacillota bacterium]
MAKMSTEDFKNNLNNPARLYLWDVMFTNPVGGGDAESLELRCQTTAIPGRSLGEILIPFKATPGIKVPGKLNMSHSWPATFVEGTDKKVFAAIHAWNQAIINARTGIGGPDTLIKANIYIRLLDSTGACYQKIRIVGCYPQSVADVPLAFETEGVVMYSVTFSYDYWEEA